MSTCDKRYKTGGPGFRDAHGPFNRSAVAHGMVHSAYASRGYANQYGSPQAMNFSGPYNQNASRMSNYVTAANGDAVEISNIPSCAPVALAPAPLAECATECVKKQACFCQGSFLLKDNNKCGGF